MASPEGPQIPWEAPEEGAESIQLPPFLLEPMGVLRRRWPWMLLALVAGLAATAAVVLTWKPVYEAQATILITSQQIPEDFVRSTVREDSINNINAMLGQILSQENLSKLIEQFSLYPDLAGSAGRERAIDRMRKDVAVGPSDEFSEGASIIYSIAYKAPEPNVAAKVANSLAELFIDASVASRNAQARRTTDFLRQALERDEKELREYSRQVSEFRRAHRGELPGELQTNLRKLEMLSQHRESLNAQIAAQENRLDVLSTQSGEREPTENEVLLDELRRQLARESAVNTDEHPNVQALRRRIARVEEAVAQDRARESGPTEQMRRLRADESFALGQLKQQLARAEREIAQLNGHIDRTPVVGEQLSALEEKEQVLREDYVASLRKVEAAELAENLESARQGGQVSMLDTAQPPTKPKRPLWLIGLGGVGASFGLALALAVLLELVDPVLLSPRQLEGVAERPVLGSLPKIA